MDPGERIHGWTDKEIMDQLEKLTGDTERDIEREALRRLMEKVSYIPTRSTGQA
jgi:hypothetical protein